MVKVLLATFALFLVASMAQAQGADVFVGYSNLQAEGIPDRNDPGRIFSDNFFGRRTGLHGVDASITGYLTKSFGITGDFSFHRKKDVENFGVNDRDTIDTRVFYFLGGPKLRFRNASRIDPYVHALFGGAQTRFKVTSQIPISGGSLVQSFDTKATD